MAERASRGAKSGWHSEIMEVKRQVISGSRGKHPVNRGISETFGIHTLMSWVPSFGHLMYCAYASFQCQLLSR